MGEHANARVMLPLPRRRVLRPDEIAGVHPAVLNELKQFPPEPPDLLLAVSDNAINDVFEIPRIAVVPIQGERTYWVWIGVREYLRLVDRKWQGKIPVLDYGPRMPEAMIAYLAEKDWLYAASILGRTHKTDWAYAQAWDANSGYICKPTKSRKRQSSGLKVFAKLNKLDRRRLRADKVSKAPEATDGPGPATDNNDEEGTEN